jgi:hypothetical protein
MSVDDLFEQLHVSEKAIELCVNFRHHVRYAMAVFRDTGDKDRLIARLTALDNEAEAP